MENKNILKKIVYILLKVCFTLIISSYFVLFINGGNTREIYSNRSIIIFIFGICIGMLIVHLYSVFIRKYRIAKITNIKLIIFTIILATITVIIGKNVFIKANEMIEISIEATGEKNINSNSSEVWITSVLNEDENVDLSQIKLSNGWKLMDGGTLVSYDNQPSLLMLTLKSSPKTKIQFISHSWSGIVKIKSEGCEETYDLYSPKTQTYNCVVENSNNTINNYIIFSTISAIIFLSSLFYIFLLYLNKKRYLGAFMILIPYSIFFIINEKITFNSNVKIISFLFTILISLSSYKILKQKDKVEYYSKNVIISLMILSFYSSFAIIGSKLLFKITYIDISLENILILLVFAMWIFSIVLVGFYILNRLYNYIPANKNIKNHSNKLAFQIFIIILLWGIIYAISFKPGNMSADSISQWGQAKGYYALYDWHPIFYTIIMRIFMNIYNSPIIIVLLQLLFFDFVITSGIMFLYKKGLNKIICIISAIIIAFKPDNMVNVITLWKDIPYSICILWLTIIIAKIISDEHYIKNKFNIIEFTICLLLILLLRHNGIVVVSLTIISILFVKIKNKRKLILYSMISLILFFIIKGPVYNSLNVTRNHPGVKYSAMMNDIEGVVFADGNIGEETKEFLEDIAPLEIHKTMYNPFSFNNFMHVEGVKYDFLNKMGEKSIGEFLEMYLDTVFKNPLLIIQNRLNGLDIMWNITQRSDSYNYRYAVGIIENDFNLQQDDNVISNVISNYLQTSYKIKFSDILNWRAGVYIILFILSIIFIVYKKKKEYILSIIPISSNILSLLVSMTWQDYRYVWFIPLSMWFIILNIIVSKKTQI